jgi:hypothetical protein
LRIHGFLLEFFQVGFQFVLVELLADMVVLDDIRDFVCELLLFS